MIRDTVKTISAEMIYWVEYIWVKNIIAFKVINERNYVKKNIPSRITLHYKSGFDISIFFTYHTSHKFPFMDNV